MNDNQQIIDLLTEIRDLLRGGGSGTAVPANTQATQSFTAETLTATVDDGKVYWKIRGGMFKKFGVTIWPETLAAAGFDAETISPLKSHDLTGYTAVYVLNEEGKAQKVIQLIPPPKPTAATAPTAAKTNGRTPAKTEPTPEPSFFRPGDKVQTTSADGNKWEGVVTGAVGDDGKIAVKVKGKIYRLELSKVEMVEPAF